MRYFLGEMVGRGVCLEHLDYEKEKRDRKGLRRGV